MAGLLPALAPHAGDDVVRRRPGRLVDQQDARAGAVSGGELGTERVDQLVVGQVGGEPRGARMPAAAVLAGDRGDVDVAVGRAQAHLAGGAARRRRGRGSTAASCVPSSERT